MKDEIKEILEFKENADYKRLSVDEIVILQDYITNLQKQIEEYQKALDETMNEKIDLQQRIDKAIEYIERNPLIWKPVIDLEKIVENPSSKLYCNADEWLTDLLNILQGESNE